MTTELCLTAIPGRSLTPLSGKLRFCRVLKGPLLISWYVAPVRWVILVTTMPSATLCLTECRRLRNRVLEVQEATAHPVLATVPPAPSSGEPFSCISEKERVIDPLLLYKPVRRLTEHRQRRLPLGPRPLGRLRLAIHRNRPGSGCHHPVLLSRRALRNTRLAPLPIRQRAPPAMDVRAGHQQVRPTVPREFKSIDAGPILTISLMEKLAHTIEIVHPPDSTLQHRRNIR